MNEHRIKILALDIGGVLDRWMDGTPRLEQTFQEWCRKMPAGSKQPAYPAFWDIWKREVRPLYARGIKCVDPLLLRAALDKMVASLMPGSERKEYTQLQSSLACLVTQVEQEGGLGMRGIRTRLEKQGVAVVGDDEWKAAWRENINGGLFIGKGDSGAAIEAFARQALATCSQEGLKALRDIMREFASMPRDISLEAQGLISFGRSSGWPLVIMSDAGKDGEALRQLLRPAGIADDIIMISSVDVHQEKPHPDFLERLRQALKMPFEPGEVAFISDSFHEVAGFGARRGSDPLPEWMTGYVGFTSLLVHADRDLKDLAHPGGWLNVQDLQGAIEFLRHRRAADRHVENQGGCMKEKIERFAKMVQEQTIAQLRAEGHGCDANIKDATTRIKNGKKYTKVDIGSSGKYMIDTKGNIFGIKAYGAIHLGHRYGTLDTIDDWDWGGYVGRKR